MAGSVGCADPAHRGNAPREGTEPLPYAPSIGKPVGGDVPIAPKSPHRRTVREAGPYDLLPKDSVGAGIHDRPTSYAAGGDRAPLPTVAPADSRALTRPPIGALLLTLAQPVLCHFVADNRGPALNPPRFICRRQRFGGFLESASLHLPLAALRRFPLQPSIEKTVGADSLSARSKTGSP